MGFAPFSLFLSPTHSAQNKALMQVEFLTQKVLFTEILQQGAFYALASVMRM
jgi:hypothetical protein